MTWPMTCVWNGRSFVPMERHRADFEGFDVGDRFRLEEREDASTNTRNHYFAQLREVWLNLPEHIAAKFPGDDGERHFRKWLLIEAGFCKRRTISCINAQEARRVAAEFGSDYDEVEIDGNIIVATEAKSQSRRSMGKKEFQASKEATLEIAANLIGLTAQELADNAGRAA